MLYKNVDELGQHARQRDSYNQPADRVFSKIIFLSHKRLFVNLIVSYFQTVTIIPTDRKKCKKPDHSGRICRPPPTVRCLRFYYRYPENSLAIPRDYQLVCEASLFALPWLTTLS